MPIDPVHRRAALIATAVTVPLLVIAAIVIVTVAGGTSSGKGPAGPIRVAAPPNVAAQTVPCTKVLVALPRQLDGLNPRVVQPHPDTPFVVAWGNPAVILRCGVDKPKALHSGSGADFILGGAPGAPYFDVTDGDDANVWTSVDRAAYVSVTIPAQYQGSDIMPPLGRAIGQALPAVCSVEPTAPIDRLCTRRA